ncbi:porin [Verrucomicrobia bacterium]|nr:porin [Verrucomicrobiota bacterium]
MRGLGLLIFIFVGLARAQDAAESAPALAASATLSGYVSTGYRWGPGTGNFAYGLSGATSRANAFSLDVVALSLRRPMENWLLDSGYRVDLWLGPDASDLDTGATTSSAELRQAYLDLRFPLVNPITSGETTSLDLRIGTFDSIVGFESPDHNANAHYTRSWGYTIQPTVHTGLLAFFPGTGRPGVDPLYEWDSRYQIALGVANTNDPRINGTPANADRKTLLAGFMWELPEALGPLGGSRFSLGYVNGRARTGSDPIHNLSLGLGLLPNSEKWNLSLTHDSRILPGAGNDDSVFGLYVGHTLSDHLSLSTRAEIYQEGAKLYSGENATEQTDGQGLTLTLNYKIWENVTSRLEYRWDNTDEPVNGRHNNQGFHLNFIYEF